MTIKHRTGIMLLLAGCFGLTAFFVVLYHVQYNNINLWPLLNGLIVWGIVSLGLLIAAIIVTSPRVLVIPLLAIFTLAFLITPRYGETRRARTSFLEKALYGWPKICLRIDTVGERGWQLDMDFTRRFEVDRAATAINLLSAVAATGLTIFSKVLAHRIREKKKAARVRRDSEAMS